MSATEFMYFEEPDIPAGLTVAAWLGPLHCSCWRCRLRRWFIIIGIAHTR